jgi:nucleotide-binding universal stress UspA family protein
MSIRSIMVPLRGAEDGESGLAMALDLGRRLEARVTVLHPAIDPRASMPYLGEGMTGAMVDDLMAAMEEEASEREGHAREVFEAIAKKADVTPVAAASGPGFQACFVAIVGRDDDLVAEQGRLHDLVLIPCPAHDDPSEVPMLQAAIMDTGRPVMIAPTNPPASVARRAAIAWNGSQQAARAVTAALDFLQTAESVLILTVEEGEQRGPSAADLTVYLDAHGIAATVKTMEPSHLPVAEALMLEASADGADLLVMGAYTHSRFRELILGGVTRDVLANLDLAVLMMH